MATWQLKVESNTVMGQESTLQCVSQMQTLSQNFACPFCVVQCNDWTSHAGCLGYELVC